MPRKRWNEIKYCNNRKNKKTNCFSTPLVMIWKAFPIAPWPLRRGVVHDEQDGQTRMIILLRHTRIWFEKIRLTHATPLLAYIIIYYTQVQKYMGISSIRTGTVIYIIYTWARRSVCWSLRLRHCIRYINYYSWITAKRKQTEKKKKN